MYDIFDGAQQDDSTECSYIESLRFGTYDEEGRLTDSTSRYSGEAKVSMDQKIMLAISFALCVGFIIYSCYLHHAMTNLLIKSLSHKELLPPSRHERARSNISKSGRNATPRRSGGGDGKEPDWEGDA